MDRNLTHDLNTDGTDHEILGCEVVNRTEAASGIQLQSVIVTD
jgi:hypothetical protein